jgi:hypothetical protein
MALGATNDEDDSKRPPGDRLAVLPDELLLQIFETLGRSSRKSLCNV